MQCPVCVGVSPLCVSPASKGLVAHCSVLYLWVYVCVSTVCICPTSGECRTSQGVSCPVQCPVMFASQRASPNCPGRQLATLPLYHFAEYTHSGKSKNIALMQLDRKYHTLSTSQLSWNSVVPICNFGVHKHLYMSKEHPFKVVLEVQVPLFSGARAPIWAMSSDYKKY